VVPVHDVIPAALASVVRGAALTPEKVAFAWRRAVGPALDQASRVELRGKVLLVRARDAAWQREIRRSSALITSRLQALLGEQTVREISVTREGT
jgi:predicted nucleic acid-binding Zn ribbon protein